MNGLGDLLSSATADVPDRYRSAPLARIRRRIRRRRALVSATVAAVVLAALLGGYAAVRPRGGPVVAPFTTAPSPVSDRLPWDFALVGRDDRTVTVYAGGGKCQMLYAPRAELTAQDAARVTVTVHGRLVEASDCASAGTAEPVVLHLPESLGSRELLDATGGARPVYRERALPDLAATGWRSHPGSWRAGGVFWYQGFDGPNGTEIELQAAPSDRASDGPGVGTVAVGPYTGTITGRAQSWWRVSWRVEQNTYSLRYVPAEGRPAGTVNDFKHLLGTLRWS